MLERKNRYPFAHLRIASSDLKMLREHLCLAQTLMKGQGGRRLQDVINEIDRHRPLGPDGKHGKLHTNSCGCEDE